MKRLWTWLFSRPWTQRNLRSAEDRINAPLDVIPSGMLSPEIAGIILNSPHMQRLFRVRDYLRRRQERS